MAVFNIANAFFHWTKLSHVDRNKRKKCENSQSGEIAFFLPLSFCLFFLSVCEWDILLTIIVLFIYSNGYIPFRCDRSLMSELISNGYRQHRIKQPVDTNDFYSIDHQCQRCHRRCCSHRWFYRWNVRSEQHR